MDGLIFKLYIRMESLLFSIFVHSPFNETSIITCRSSFAVVALFF